MTKHRKPNRSNPAWLVIGLLSVGSLIAFWFASEVVSVDVRTHRVLHAKPAAVWVVAREVYSDNGFRLVAQDPAGWYEGFDYMGTAAYDDSLDLGVAVRKHGEANYLRVWMEGSLVEPPPYLPPLPPSLQLMPEIADRLNLTDVENHSEKAPCSSCDARGER